MTDQPRQEHATDEIELEFLPMPDQYKVVAGKDGWLFLDSDSNNVMEQHAGELRFSDDQLAQWQFLVESRAAWLERHGARYFFLVPPNAHSVYPEMLPDHVQSGDRPILQLLRHFERYSPARPIYPLEDMVREKHRPIYYKTGTHWTELGAFVAYRRLMDEMTQAVDVPRLSEDDLELVEQIGTGDLGTKVRPVQRSVFVYADIRDSRARVVTDNRVSGTGRYIEYRRDDAPDIDCLVFGDSFAMRLVPLLAESFRRLVFAHIETLDHRLALRERPDVVVSVMNERFMIAVPCDLPARTLEQHAASKRAAGKVLPPPTATGTRVNRR